jgi:hypothetical protein
LKLKLGLLNSDYQQLTSGAKSFGKKLARVKQESLAVSQEFVVLASNFVYTG